MQPYIVYLGSHSHGLSPSLLDLQLVTKSHYDLLGSVLGRWSSFDSSGLVSYNGYSHYLLPFSIHCVAKRYPRKLFSTHTTDISMASPQCSMKNKPQILQVNCSHVLEVNRPFPWSNKLETDVEQIYGRNSKCDFCFWK